MPKQALENLTEAMFYTLMALTRGESCGTEISAFAAEVSAGAVRLGPATLYTLLAKFEKEGFIAEAGTVGCKRYYRLTAAGKAAYEGERARLNRCLLNAAKAETLPRAELSEKGEHPYDKRDNLASPALPLL